VEPDDELGVLGEAVVVVAARVDHVLAPEDAERARDDQDRTDARPARAPHEERPEVLDYLKVHEQLARRARLGHVSGLDGGTVGYPDDAAERHGLRPHLELTHEARQGVHVEQRVRVHAEEQRVARVSEPRIHGVCSAASVLLVDHHEALVVQAPVGAQDRLGLEPRPRHPPVLDEVVALGERGERAVVGAVVDDDHLEVRVVAP
jgi:hypothetical protein